MIYVKSYRNKINKIFEKQTLFGVCKDIITINLSLICLYMRF